VYTYIFLKLKGKIMNTIFKIATLAAVLTLVACGPEQEVVETVAVEAVEAVETIVVTGNADSVVDAEAAPAADAAPEAAAPATTEGTL
jgi:hypothetical protein